MQHEGKNTNYGLGLLPHIVHKGHWLETRPLAQSISLSF